MKKSSRRCLSAVILLCLDACIPYLQNKARQSNRMKRFTGNDSTGIAPKVFTSLDYIKITIFGLGLGALWNSLHGIILPIRLLDFVAEAEKNTYLGLLTFSGLMLAMLVQPIIGTISDRSGLRWGRRRPYILVGTLVTLAFIPGIGFFGNFAAIAAIYLLLQVSANVAQGPYQAFIPDIVPEEKRGLASGWKSLLEIAGALAVVRLVAQFMDSYYTGQESSWLWLALGTVAIVLLGTMLVTVLMVKERPGTGSIKLPSFLTSPQTLMTNLKGNFLPIFRQTFKIDVKGNPDFVFFLISRLLFMMTFITFQTFALYLLKDISGVADPAAATANVMIVAGACMVASVYPAGRLSDRIGRKPILLLSGIVGASSIAVIYIFHNDYQHLLIGVGLLGVSYGAFWSSNWALATDLVSKGEEARYLGLVNLATAGGSALARLIGPAIDFFNAQSPQTGYYVMLLACFIYLVVGTVLITRIKGKR